MDIPSLFKKRMESLPGNLWPAFEEAYRSPLRRGLRINTSKISVERFLTIFPHKLTPSPFCNECFYLDVEHKAGADPLHHAGAYYMQEPSASAAVTVLAPQPGERILDLCAAPGGKSTQILSALQGSGLLWSNEYVAKRAYVLQQNLERMGGRNVVVSSNDTAVLCRNLAGLFDGILVDAPCSGEGMFRKEPQALTEWSMDNVRLCAERQLEILHNASLALAPNGRIVYSTCTFAPEENEGVVARFLESHPDFSLVTIDVSWGAPGFNPEDLSSFISTPHCRDDLSKCRRIFPHQGGEGHFVALLMRRGGAGGFGSEYMPPAKDPHANKAKELYDDCFCASPEGHFVTFGQKVRLLPSFLPALNGCNVLSAGVAAANVCRDRLEPEHGVFLSAKKDECRRVLDLPLSDPRITAFLHGEEILTDTEPGWTTVCVDGLPVGFGKSVGNRLKNRYPKGLRLL